jgi:hypothetical protein
MNKFLKIIGRLTLAAFILILHYLIISPLLKTKEDLTSINGTVNNQSLIHHNKPKNSFDAYILSLNNSELKFAIQDNKERAFDYLSHNNIIGKPINILYDSSGHNESWNLTYHLYEVTVNGNIIMTMSESKRFYKWGLLWLLVMDSLIPMLYFWAKRKKQRSFD